MLSQQFCMALMLWPYLNQQLGILSRFSRLWVTPRSTARAASWIEAGLKPISLRIQLCHVLCAWGAVSGKKDWLTTAVFQAIMQEGNDPWVKEITRVSSVVGPLTSFPRKLLVKKAMITYAIEAVMAVKWSQPSLDWMSIPVHWSRVRFSSQQDLE